MYTFSVSSLCVGLALTEFGDGGLLDSKQSMACHSLRQDRSEAILDS